MMSYKTLLRTWQLPQRDAFPYHVTYYLSVSFVVMGSPPLESCFVTSLIAVTV
jgi:hypothetical protein